VANAYRGAEVGRRAGHLTDAVVLGIRQKEGGAFNGDGEAARVVQAGIDRAVEIA